MARTTRSVFLFALAIPVTIPQGGTLILDRPGTYVLQNSVVDHPMTAIRIDSSNVVLRLNNNLIAGDGSGATGPGILVGTGRPISNIAVEGPGLIREFTDGVVFSDTHSSVIEHLSCVSNSGSGVLLGNDSSDDRVSDDDLSDNLQSGIRVGMSGRESNGWNRISENRCDSNGRSGIELLSGASDSVVEANSVRRNGGPGISLERGAVENRILSNIALGNRRGDLIDMQPGCSSNFWWNNLFDLTNRECVR